jgi:hemoglobin
LGNDRIPTLAEWAGGSDALLRLTTRFYEKVPSDAVLAPVFAGMSPKHASHVANFIAEVFGGGTAYTSGGGSHAAMIGRHLGRQLTHEQRKRWIAMMQETADEVGLPDDPEFRAAFVGYLEWGTRLAVMNSQEGVAPPNDNSQMPAWNWGPPGGPYRGSGD